MAWGAGMDGLQDVLETIRDRGWASGHLPGVFHIAIGRKLELNGTVLHRGVTWRQLASLLKAVKYDKDWVRDLGIDPSTISPKDREKFWYSVIGMVRPDSELAITDAEWLAVQLNTLGIVVS